MITLFKSSKKVVEAIHNEIDTAQDRLLNEAKNIIASQKMSDVEKAERLERVGFVNSEVVARVKSKSIVESKEQAELIEYYKHNYPFQKFITEKEMDRICQKYNLIYAPVYNYKKDVPEKNLKEIERVAYLKDSDCSHDYCYATGFMFSHLKEANKWFVENVGLNKPFESNRIRGDFFTVPSEFGGYTFLKGIRKIDKQGFFIAAPKTHFDLKGLKSHGLFGFMNTSIIEVKDPIVFRYCRGGIQIITKWGLEASDEIVVNEKLN